MQDLVTRWLHLWHLWGCILQRSVLYRIFQGRFLLEIQFLLQILHYTWMCTILSPTTISKCIKDVADQLMYWRYKVNIQDIDLLSIPTLICHFHLSTFLSHNPVWWIIFLVPRTCNMVSNQATIPSLKFWHWVFDNLAFLSFPSQFIIMNSHHIYVSFDIQGQQPMLITHISNFWIWQVCRWAECISPKYQEECTLFWMFIREKNHRQHRQCIPSHPRHVYWKHVFLCTILTNKVSCELFMPSMVATLAKRCTFEF